MTKIQLNDSATERYPGTLHIAKTLPYLRQLWDESLTASVDAAAALYQSDNGDPIQNETLLNEIVLQFRRDLLTGTPRLPETEGMIYIAIVGAVWRTLRQARERLMRSPFDQENATGFRKDFSSEEMLSWWKNIETDKVTAAESLLLALRPVRRLEAGVMTAEICVILRDFHQKHALLQLKKPERYYIENALALTLAAQPPDQLYAFWKYLQSDNPQIRQSMRFGLKFFRSAHAVPHLLTTLENVQDHDIRAEIVDILEQIGEPSALPVLARLKKETALTDWPLSRHIGRAIKIIERQDKNRPYGTLLRSSEAPPAIERQLLRPARAAQLDAERDRDELLRPNANRTENEP